jgi:hypothetical protein
MYCLLRKQIYIYIYYIIAFYCDIELTKASPIVETESGQGKERLIYIVFVDETRV